jgi:preprotein translocase subunit SecE
VAEKRQRSKQRQAERRAQRLAQQGNTGGRSDRARGRDPELEEAADLQVGAPPEDLGQPEHFTRHENPPPPDFEVDDEELIAEAKGSGAPPEAPEGPRGVRGDGGDPAAGPGQPLPKERGRLLEFLKAVWAELQRVQWPDRRQTTQLTGVVLFFVLIVGAYLGGLDAIFSKLIQSIL